MHFVKMLGFIFVLHFIYSSNKFSFMINKISNSGVVETSIICFILLDKICLGIFNASESLSQTLYIVTLSLIGSICINPIISPLICL